MITYKIGDCTNPTEEGKKLIIHVVNNYGGWGAGFVVALSKMWKEPEKYYRNTFERYNLGEVQFVYINQDIVVANMFAQNGYLSDKNKQPLCYDSLEKCLLKVKEFAQSYKCSIIAPRFGSGLASGNWIQIEKLINKIMLDITIYDLP